MPKMCDTGSNDAALTLVKVPALQVERHDKSSQIFTFRQALVFLDLHAGPTARLTSVSVIDQAPTLMVKGDRVLETELLDVCRKVIKLSVRHHRKERCSGVRRKY